MQEKIRILLTGGGTGGHIFPLAAVAEKLSKYITTAGYEPDIRYFGDPKQFRSVLENSGIKVIHITPSKWRRYFDVQNFFDVFRFFISIIQGLWKIFWFMPHACFSKGGPGAFSVVAVCRFYTIPIIIHESDATPGLTTKLSAKFAKFIELAFAGAASELPAKAKTHYVGNPVRETLLGPEDKKASKIEFGFNSEEPVILFLCGSQGAEKINDFVLENIEGLTQKFQILHQTGSARYESHAQQYNFTSSKYPTSVGERYKFFPFFDHNLASAYQAADAVVSRAGAGVIFELAAFEKPAILVPLPTSANNHQLQNAYEYEKAGAAVVIEEDNFLPAILVSEIETILRDAQKRETMEKAAKSFYVPNSAALIARDILETAGFQQ